MKKCVVLKKYRDMQMDNKLFKKGDIVSYEEDRANKLAVLGYLKIVEDIEVKDLDVQEETTNSEESDKNKASVKSSDLDKDNEDAESDKDNEDAESDKDNEDTESDKDNEDTESDKDNEDTESDKDDKDAESDKDNEDTESDKDDKDAESDKDIEMASMPKKSKKKM